MQYPTQSRLASAVLWCLALVIVLCPTVAVAAPPGIPIHVVPASRVEQINSPPDGLPDQEVQYVEFDSPLNTSLITVFNAGGTGHRSFALVFEVQGGGTFMFSAKEDGDDVNLALTQPIPVTAVWIRCDSFSDVVCRYAVSLVGD